jgi:hypothetical protein
LHSVETDGPINYLDTPLWAWAEVSEAKGEWLIEVLKYMNQLQLVPTPTEREGDKPLGWWRLLAANLQGINREFGIHIGWLDDIGRDEVGHRTGLLHVQH